MEELSFKPITKGLGFHKSKLKIDEKALRDIHWNKEVELPEIDFIEDDHDEPALDAAAEKAWLEDASLGQTVTSYRKPNIDLLAEDFSLEKVQRELEQKALLSKTLPRNDVAKNKAVELRSETLDRKPTRASVLGENLDEIRKLEKRTEESKVEDVVTAQRNIQEEKSAGNWFAALIDFVVVFGLVNLFMSSLLFVTKLDVFQIVSSSYKEPMTQLSLALLFLGSCFLYTVITRSFFGMTLGDWATDMQLGTEKQRSSVFYPLRVSLRFFVNLLSGLFLLPFLSVIFRKDLSGVFTGLSLYKLKD